MAIEAVVESLEQVPEALHEHYEEKDGKFYVGYTKNVHRRLD